MKFVLEGDAESEAEKTRLRQVNIDIFLFQGTTKPI